MQTPAIELEWDGIRVVGSFSQKVIQALYYLLTPQFTEKWVSGSHKSRLTFILEARKTAALLDVLAEDPLLGDIVANCDDKKFLSSWPRLSPTAWLSLSEDHDCDGSYIAPNRKVVITRWKGTTNILPLPPWILDSTESDQLAFLAAAFAFTHRYDLARE